MGPRFKVHTHAHAQLRQLAKLMTCSPALSPKPKFYSQIAIMATGRGITVMLCVCVWGGGGWVIVGVGGWVVVGVGGWV